MDGKARFRAFVVVVVVALAGGVLYAVANVGAEADTGWTLVVAAILVSMAVVAIAVGLKERANLKSGFPREDERSRAIRMRAGYLAFFIGLYFLLGMGLIQGILEDRQIVSLPTSEWAMIYVAALGSIFLGLHTYLNRKGVPA
jgi:membrane protease YdiL (CAAX protease family)